MRTLALLFLTTLACFGQGFSDASAPFLLSTSSLRKGLVGYWRLEEASGTRYDCSKNGNHLTSNNSVGQSNGVSVGTGKCANFVKTSNQYLSHTDSATLKGFTNLTLACWVKMDTVPGGSTYPVILSKYKSASGFKEYELYYDGDVSRFSYITGTNATTGQAWAKANTFGAPVTNVWYFVCGWSDGTNNNISINNGTADSVSNTFPINSSTNPLVIGSDASFLGLSMMDGKVDECGIWSRVLSSAERTFLYNAGKGTHFPWAHP